MNTRNKLQTVLEQRLITLTKLNSNEWSINTEEHVECPVITGFRRIDVVADPDDHGQAGYAFEIKTESSSRHHISVQLRDYLISGYRPILVAPESILDKQLPRSTHISIEWIVDFLDVTFISFDGEESIDFNVVENKLPQSDDLRPLLEKL